MNDATEQATRAAIASMPIAQLLAGEIPGVEWVHGDDLCDCTFQRIGEWTNPYLGATLRVRLCCVWAKLAEQYPDFVQTIPTYYDENRGEFLEGTIDWDAEYDMPRAIWYRQLAARTGKTLAEIRGEYADQEPPKGTPRARQVPQAVLETLKAAHAGMREATEDDNGRSH